MSDVTLSVGLPNFGGWFGDDWGRLIDLARAAEDAGVHRVVVNDHVVMGRNTHEYVWGRFPVPPEAPWLEPMTVLTAMAAATTTVRLSTGIVVAPLRPAPLLAKTVATVDLLSGGRVDLGVGVGWQREEYDACGLDFAERGQLLTDTIAACRALWTQLPCSFASPTASFSDIVCSPQPVQRRLPVWFSGTMNGRNLRRVTELGDGWIVIMGASRDEIAAGTARLREAGRPGPDGAPGRDFGVQAPVPVVRDAAGRADPDATMAGAPDLLAAGVTDVYVNVRALCAEPDDAPAALASFATAFAAAVPR